MSLYKHGRFHQSVAVGHTWGHHGKGAAPSPPEQPSKPCSRHTVYFCKKSCKPRRITPGELDYPRALPYENDETIVPIAKFNSNLQCNGRGRDRGGGAGEGRDRGEVGEGGGQRMSF
jgi:hypothetical protein